MRGLTGRCTWRDGAVTRVSLGASLAVSQVNARALGAQSDSATVDSSMNGLDAESMCAVTSGSARYEEEMRRCGSLVELRWLS